MNIIYATGGKQRRATINVDEWSQYQSAVVIGIDVESRKAISNCSYETPSQFLPDVDTPSILFKSGSIDNNKLYVATQTEVLVYELPGYELERHISLPIFNDVHHVLPQKNGHILVAVTGLDLVVELDENGNVLREWSTCTTDTWEKFSRDIDYRKVVTTKPHLSHPNFVFTYQDEIWVTRFEQKDAMCLNVPGKCIKIDVERPHDGFVYGNQVYFTTVNGHIVVANLDTLETVNVIDLQSASTSDDALGWCRGLHVLNEKYALVGFSRIRPTKFHQNLLWLRGQLKGQRNVKSQPTRVALVDLTEGKIEWEIDLEELGLNAVFSIIAK